MSRLVARLVFFFVCSQTATVCTFLAISFAVDGCSAIYGDTTNARSPFQVVSTTIDGDTVGKSAGYGPADYVCGVVQEDVSVSPQFEAKGWGIGYDVWYKFVATSREVSLSTCGSPIDPQANDKALDTVIAVYESSTSSCDPGLPLDDLTVPESSYGSNQNSQFLKLIAANNDHSDEGRPGNDQNNNGECGNDGGDSAYFSYLQLRCLKIGTTYCVRIGGHGGSCDRDADRCPPLVSETTTPDELDADGCPLEQETSTVVVRKRSLESSESNLRKRDLQPPPFDCQADKGPFKLVVQGLCVGSTGHSGDSGDDGSMGDMGECSA